MTEAILNCRNSGGRAWQRRGLRRYPQRRWGRSPPLDRGRRPLPAAHYSNADRTSTADGQHLPDRRKVADRSGTRSNTGCSRRGRPLESHEVIVDLIGATTTRTGLKVRAALDLT
jgi:hypothetical protein